MQIKVVDTKSKNIRLCIQFKMHLFIFLKVLDILYVRCTYRYYSFYKQSYNRKLILQRMFILSKFKNRLSENKQKTQVNSYLTLISGCEIGIDDLNVAVENVEQSGHLHLQHEVKVGQRDPGSLLVP